MGIHPFDQGFGYYPTDGGTIEGVAEGFTFTATVHSDHDAGTPWERDCGHGPVTDWTTRRKAPGELILNQDRGSFRYYDFAGAVRIAQRDGWGAPLTLIKGETPRQKAARAARFDYETLKAWCNDEWRYVGIAVTASREGVELGRASLWGVEADHPADPYNEYLQTVANEIAGEAMSEAREMLARLCNCSVEAVR